MERSLNLAQHIIEVRLLPVAMLEYGYHVVNGSTQRLLKYMPGADWEIVYFTASTALLSETPDNGTANRLINQVIQINYPGDDSPDMSRFGNQRHAVVVKYEDGAEYVFGSPDVPMLGSWEFNSERKGYVLKFTRKVPN
jgi:hypothetical protein